MIASTPWLADETGDQRLVAGLADDERHALGNGPVEAGGQIVEHDDALAGVDQRMDHVAADIAGAAGDQDCHAVQPYSESINIRLGREGLN